MTDYQTRGSLLFETVVAKWKVLDKWLNKNKNSLKIKMTDRCFNEGFQMERNMGWKLEEVRWGREITMRGAVHRVIWRGNPDCSDQDCMFLTHEYDVMQYAILLVILGHCGFHGTNNTQIIRAKYKVCIMHTSGDDST